ncbi:MAG: hypothetical protein QXP97_07580 [Desulfurococcus sp.]|uniref:A/G-specific adenine glycosylase n=1 Tax=Desulfurococcus sp. TaxID=51678 RepID=UPI003165822E
MGETAGCSDLTEGVLVEELRRRVAKWEREHWVPYPWRVDRTPYKVLIAELLLKRTTRQAVSREFPKFIQKFPDFESVYRASIEEVEEAFRHLGLYRQRAKQLKELAKIVIERYGGRIPDRWEDLVQLPGIGVYLAGAVLSFGYGQKAPVLDSNVIRLLTRLTGMGVKRHEEYLQILWRLTPDSGHDYFNYGLIDLGALVCHYKQPKCGVCPLKDLCAYYLRGTSQDCARRLEGIYRRLFRSAQREPF